MKRNTASQVVGAQLINKADGTPCTTGTTTVYVTGDGGTQAVGSVGSGACAHEGNGFYTYAPSQAETNYDHVAFTFVNSAAISATVQVYPSFPQTGDNYARLGAPAGASVSADVAAVKAVLPAALVGGRIDASVDAAGVRGAVGLASANLDTQLGALPTAAENADKMLGRSLAGGADGGRTVKDALRSLRNKTSISAGTLTVCEEDDSTPAWTASVTTTPGDPLSAIDPA